MKNHPCTRRTFLKAAVGSTLALPLLAPSIRGANGKLQHACVGVGGMGRSDLQSIVRGGKVRIVALCDVDANNLASAIALLKNEYGQEGIRTYTDWREMFAKEGDRIDSVNVTTPDHTHAPVAMTAIRNGKHVYCQKPLTHTVFEARQLTEAARKAGVKTQMGIQIHSDIAYRMAVRIIQDGALGKIKEWHSFQGPGPWPTGGRPEGSDPVPANLDWEQWIGVAPMRPYKERVYHPAHWRGWQDFGCGVMGDFACHIFDPPYTAMKLSHCRSIKTTCAENNGETFPVWQISEFEFEGTEYTESTVRGTWYNGERRPSRDLVPMPAEYKLPGAGSIIVGSEGVMVLPHWAGPQLYPLEKFRTYQRPKVKSVDHYQLWVDACLGGEKTEADFDYSGPLTETTLLGNLGIYYPGQTLNWDAKNFRFTNADEANKRLHKIYRKGWEVEGLIREA